MGYILAVFAVRTETMQFYNMLKRAGINAMIVETPKSLQASCGISVKLMQNDFSRANNILRTSNMRSFVRFYLVNGTFGRRTISPINLWKYFFIYLFCDIITMEFFGYKINTWKGRFYFSVCRILEYNGKYLSVKISFITWWSYVKLGEDTKIFG